MDKKKIVFLTGTRADFGKQKSLIEITSKSKNFETHIFITGMHMLTKYGATSFEVESCGFKNTYQFINQTHHDSMDCILAKTIEGFSHYVQEIKPDLIVVHGDRVEALAGAIVGSLNNILVAHLEGGELSGTVDELIRHAVSKLSHVHLVANHQAEKRLIQMGEHKDSIFIIGSPDIDIMESDKLKSLSFVKKRYGIKFNKYAILIFHPVTTEIASVSCQANNITDAVIDSGSNFVVIYPNNDFGSDLILNVYKKLDGNARIKVFSSIRFEYFIILLKNAQFILGNSSSGIREAPYFGIPTINIGSRQNSRALSKEIIHCGYSKSEIITAIDLAKNIKVNKTMHFGSGKSDKFFIKLLNSGKLWRIAKQKLFCDL
ncbi:MAG: UDP-N-acetylglucosamine 2-epimerase (hydrolyzing) [Candidatus Omnitrophica bacterium]|nr:UDP-N-acetylglucosamine 2-epimerase (hydrolyzing) [Candidatus Omnitrophota bacterium]